MCAALLASLQARHYCMQRIAMPWLRSFCMPKEFVFVKRIRLSFFCCWSGEGSGFRGLAHSTEKVRR